MKRDPKKFYDNLMNENNNFTFFTKDTRFNVNKLLVKKNIIKYFDKFIENYIENNCKILDYGCGPGTFSVKLSRMTCNEVHGVDISGGFIDQCLKIKKELKVNNFHPKQVKDNVLPFNDNTFDTVLIFDVIHHLDNIDENFREINRVLKTNGKIIVYEPNKLNPLIWLMHFIDSNEGGLLKVGTKNKYYKILKKHNFKPVKFAYSGIVVGPNSNLLNFLSNFLNIEIVYKFFGWLNPKLVFIAEKE